MAMGLTNRQSELLGFIELEMSECGVPPSYSEMMEHLGLHSKSGVSRLIDGLVERGYVRRLARRTRAIELLRPSEPIACPHCGNAIGSAACRGAALRELERTMPSRASA